MSTTNLIAVMTLISVSTFAQMKYPKTKKIDHIDNYHGTQVADPYRWLEDDNSEETKAWVKAQNEVSFGYLNQIPLREEFKKRIEALSNYEKFQLHFAREIGFIFIKIQVYRINPFFIVKKAFKENLSKLLTQTAYPKTELLV